jgi:hypothetical protein
MNAVASDVRRSLRTDVRNPLLGLPSMQRAMRMGKLERLILRDLCREIAADARDRAETCWKRHKAPMAAYWKAVAVYAGHTARALSSSLKRNKAQDDCIALKRKLVVSV